VAAGLVVVVVVVGQLAPEEAEREFGSIHVQSYSLPLVLAVAAAASSVLLLAYLPRRLLKTLHRNRSFHRPAASNFPPRANAPLLTISSSSRVRFRAVSFSPLSSSSQL